jgi:hypothetical protein
MAVVRVDEVRGGVEVDSVPKIAKRIFEIPIQSDAAGVHR